MLLQGNQWLLNTLMKERHQFVLWFPVFIGLGIHTATYIESLLIPLLGAGFTALAGLILFFCKKKPFIFYAATPVLLFFMGMSAMFYKKAQIQTPIINHAFNTPLWIKGTVEKIQHGRKEKRIKLVVHRIQNIQEAPKKLSFTYKFKQEKAFEVGDTLTFKAKLSPLGKQVVPNGYDFEKQALFQNIGGQGYITYIHKIRKPKETGAFFLFFTTLRQRLTQKILSHIPNQEGAIAAALITGDTTEIKKETRQAFVNSGTAHILAISGLHLTLVGGLLFLIFRLIGLCWPPIFLYMPAPKIGAVLSIIGTFFYLQISGGRIPSMRAFFSFSLIMTAILINRTPISLRMVSFSAIIILLLYPESLSTPSFQLSFAAVTGLVAFYERSQLFLTGKTYGKRILFYFCSLFVSSLIASLATTPFIAYHFYKVTLHAISANLIVIPLLSFLIMPLLLLWVCLAPWPFMFEKLSQAIAPLVTAMHETAAFFSGLKGSIIFLTGLSAVSFSLIVFGGLFLCLLKTKLRYAGAALIAAGICHCILFPKERPDLFLANQGTVIGFVDKGHLYTTQRRKKTFLSEIWGDYHGIPQGQRHRLSDRRHPLKNNLTVSGNNILVHTERFSLWVENEHQEKYPHAHIWISKIRHHKPDDFQGHFIGEKDLPHTRFIYAGKSFSK